MCKKIFSLIIFFIIISTHYGSVLAKEIKIPAGTPIMIYSEKEIDADDVKMNENISFVVQNPVYVNDKIVIKADTEVVGQVIKRKNNSILGISGEIQVGNFKIKHSNQVINLRGTIINKGDNRAWVNLGWIFWITLPMVFIKGNDGKIPAGTYQMLYTIGDNFVNIN